MDMVKKTNSSLDACLRWFLPVGKEDPMCGNWKHVSLNTSVLAKMRPASCFRSELTRATGGLLPRWDVLSQIFPEIKVIPEQGLSAFSSCGCPPGQFTSSEFQPQAVESNPCWRRHILVYFGAVGGGKTRLNHPSALQRLRRLL